MTQRDIFFPSRACRTDIPLETNEVFTIMNHHSNSFPADSLPLDSHDPQRRGGHGLAMDSRWQSSNYQNWPINHSVLNLMTLNANVIFLESSCSAPSSFSNLEMRVWFRENGFYNRRKSCILSNKKSWRFPFTPDPTYSLMVKLTLNYVLFMAFRCHCLPLKLINWVTLNGKVEEVNSDFGFCPESD